MTERSAGDDTNVSSASMDDAAGQPKRYAHGSGIGEAVRARATQEMIRGEKTMMWSARQHATQTYCAANSRVEAFREVLAWIDELEADAASTWHEAGMPIS